MRLFQNASKLIRKFFEASFFSSLVFSSTRYEIGSTKSSRQDFNMIDKFSDVWSVLRPPKKAHQVLSDWKYWKQFTRKTSSAFNDNNNNDNYNSNNNNDNNC